MTDVITRESPWGTLAVADAHVHFFSPHFFELLAGQKPGLTVEGIRAQLQWHSPADLTGAAQEWINELDRHGVARAALIASLPGDEGSSAAAAATFPERIFPCALANPRAWNADSFAAIRMACLFPAMHSYSVQDDLARPVFEWARDHQRAVFVHCGVLSVAFRGKLGLPSPFDLRFSNPIDLHAIALRYPTVPIVVPHFGAGYFREALMLADLCPNVYLDTSSSNSWMRYQEAHLDLRQVFRRALDVVGPQRLLFGSDSSFFPRGWHQQIYEDQTRALYELGVSLNDARAIFGENLLRILHP